MKRPLPMLLAALTFCSCAAIPIAPERLAQPEAAIRGAEEVGANQVPAARLHLQLARDQIALAKRLAGDGDARAPMLLTRAQTDAELALALARETATHLEAQKATDELAAVQGRATP